MEKNIHNLTILNDFSFSWMSVDIYKNIFNGEYVNIKILEIYSLLKFFIYCINNFNFLSFERFASRDMYF